MPPRKQAPGPRPRAPRAFARRSVPQLSTVSGENPPVATTVEASAKEKRVEEVGPTITASETAPPSPVAEFGDQKAELRTSGDPISDKVDHKSAIASEVLVERPQVAIDSKAEKTVSEQSENGEKVGNEENAAAENSKTKKKKVVKVVKKVVKKVVRKKLVPKKMTHSPSDEEELDPQEVWIDENGMLGGGSVSVPTIITHAEGAENVTGMEECGREMGGPGMEIAMRDEKKEWAVSGEAQQGLNGYRIEELGGKEEPCGAGVVFGDDKNSGKTEKLKLGSDLPGKKRRKVTGMEEFRREKEALGIDVAKTDEKKEWVVSDVVQGGLKGDGIEELEGNKEPCGAGVEVGDCKDGGKTKKLKMASDVLGEERNLLGSSAKDEQVKADEKEYGEGDFKEECEKSNGMIALSGELEALERKKRRKTEIFIGGLDKDTKEEDIRKIFEQVGEIVEVRLFAEGKAGKNRGFAFVRYASAADAKMALEKYKKVEICGKQCGTSLVAGNDTLFLGNIDKKWKNEDVLKLMQEIGIKKIDKVTVMTDPRNVDRNRGFAFLELETNKDAQNAYKKLQRKEGRLQNIKVAWAEPLSEPNEEEMLKVKSVYAEYLPSSWDEKKMRDHFKKFGEIESVVLSRNLPTARRKDFAFVNFTTREAALACIESFNHEQLTDGDSKVNLKVSLAKPIPKAKPNEKASNSLNKEVFKQQPAGIIHGSIQPNESQSKRSSARHYGEDTIDDRRSSATVELVRRYGKPDSHRQPQERLDMGSANQEYSYSLSGMKRPSSYALDDDPYLSYPREYTRPCWEGSFPVGSPLYSEVPRGLGMSSLPYHQQHGAGYTSTYRNADYAASLQRDEAFYPGSGGWSYRY